MRVRHLVLPLAVCLLILVLAGCNCWPEVETQPSVVTHQPTCAHYDPATGRSGC